MNTVKVVAKLLFWFSRFLAFIYLASTFLSLLALTTGFGLRMIEDGKRFQILLPFSQKAFLLGDYNATYIFYYFLLPISLYGIFFWLLGNVFRVFYQPKLFTTEGVKHLRIFYTLNLVVPPLVLILSSIFAEVEDATIVLTTLHLTLAVFAYFLAAIFRQGLHLQKEQDLYI